MNHMTEDERILGDPPEPPAEVWSAALAHAFDPWAEPNASILPGEGDLHSYDPHFDDDLAAVVDTDTDTDDADDVVVGDTLDTPYDDDTPGFDDNPGYTSYENPGYADPDDYL